MLPDLAGMAGLSFDDALVPEEVRRGVAYHHATDTAFHAHAAFRSGTAAIRDDLAKAGVGRGPARASAHIGWELLLDGSIIGAAGLGAVPAAVAAAPSLTAALAAADRERWVDFVARLHERAPWQHYGDPGAVA